MNSIRSSFFENGYYVAKKLIDEDKITHLVDGINSNLLDQLHLIGINQKENEISQNLKLLFGFLSSPKCLVKINFLFLSNPDFK